MGAQAVAILREGLRNLTPADQQVLRQQIDVRVQDIFGRAFGPEMFQFLAPFTAEERNGNQVATRPPLTAGGAVGGGPQPGGGSPTTGGGSPIRPPPNPLAAVGGARV